MGLSIFWERVRGRGCVCFMLELHTVPFHVSVTESPHMTVRMSRQFMSLVINLLASMLQF